MSLTEKNASCALCKAYLFEEDDIVYCPVCGAPHHRECYNSIGHCALESAHGTENQYDKIKNAQPKKEESQFENKTFESQNSHNDTYTPGDEIFRNLPPIDFLGGVPADYVIEDGVTAKEARNFVISNTTRYIPKFTKLNKNNKLSWNFLAFFFPCEWLLSRKMYKSGLIIGLLNLISALLTVPLNNNLLNLGFQYIEYTEFSNFLVQNLGNINYLALIVAFVGCILEIILRFATALFGDWWYKKHTISKIKEIKAESDDIAEDFRKYGGVNIFLFLIALLALQNLPTVIAMII